MSEPDQKKLQEMIDQQVTIINECQKEINTLIDLYGAAIVFQCMFHPVCVNLHIYESVKPSLNIQKTPVQKGN